MISMHHGNSRAIVSAGVNVYVTDIERSHAWYSEVLGLAMEMSPDRQSSSYFEPLAESDRKVVFRLIPRFANHDPQSRVALTFHVGNLEGTVASLRSLGVPIGRERSCEAGCVLASVTVLDTDGNEIVLYEL